jgi:hypothetical protein
MKTHSCLELLETRIAPATHIWIGPALGGLWSDAGNWNGGVPTSNEAGGTIVQFNGGINSTDDLAGLWITQLHFTAGGNTITGAGSATLEIGGAGVAHLLNDAGVNTVAASLPLVVAGGSDGVTVTAGTLVIAGEVRAPDTLPQVVAMANFSGTVNLQGQPILDLLVADAKFQRVAIFQGNPNGGFNVEPTLLLGLPAGAVPKDVVVSDFNGDNKPDFAIANSGLTTTGSVQFFQNNSIVGALSFGQLSLDGGRNPVGIVAADFDGDTKKDLAVVNSTLNGASNFTATILLGNGSGAFSSPMAFKLGDAVPNAAELTTPTGLAQGNLNGDALPDLAFSGANGVQVLRNTTAVAGLPTFAALAARLSNTATTSVAIGLIDSDGILDVVASTDTGGGQVLVFKNDGAATPGFVTAGPFAAGSTPRDVTLADLNGDSKNDILVVNSLTSGTLGILINSTSGAPSFAAPTTAAVGDTPRALAVGDPNHDGLVDVVVGNIGSHDLTRLSGQGNGTFTPAATSGPGGILGTPTFAKAGNGTLVIDGDAGGIAVNVTGGILGGSGVVGRLQDSIFGVVSPGLAGPALFGVRASLSFDILPALSSTLMRRAPAPVLISSQSMARSPFRRTPPSRFLPAPLWRMVEPSRS